MSRSLKLKDDTWFKIKAKLRASHPPSVLLSRSKMREVLGFTDRDADYRDRFVDRYGKHHRAFYLDFFDEKKRTIFLLKYGDFLNDDR